MNYKPILLRLVLMLLPLEGIGETVFANEVLFEKRCFDRIVSVWGGARSYSIEKRLPHDQPILTKNVIPYLTRGEENARCPFSADFYPAFLLSDGPVCHSGHTFKSENKKYPEVVSFFGSKKDIASIRELLGKDDIFLRRIGIRWTLMIENKEAAVDILKKNVGDKDPVVRLQVFERLARIGGSDALTAFEEFLPEQNKILMEAVYEEVSGAASPESALFLLPFLRAGEFKERTHLKLVSLFQTDLGTDEHVWRNWIRQRP